MKLLHKAALALALLGGTGIAVRHAATGWAPSPADFPLQGVDLGEEPGAVEWGTVRAQGADFAYLAATAGADRRVPSFEANWNALPAAGLRRGAVHLYSFCQDGRDQANAFNTVVPRVADALPAAVDVQFRDDCTARPDRAALVADLARFVETVEAHTGKPVLLRIAEPVEDDYRLTEAIDRPVWSLANFLRPDYAARPWRLWRASDLRRIEGIEGPVNWDVVAP
ncbi:GH25 family lysozyme [Sphingomonas rubra]|uniref:Lysozyme n=1 Tax=Sphingomonas rubra TaxID=634430 RepID=A0A1I5PQE1_9SPHN|nr:GH25 family lysozyme [Sphingomonas rubra]SFP36348.1 lysozyme [Sphingomonas rubra]